MSGYEERATEWVTQHCDPTGYSDRCASLAALLREVAEERNAEALAAERERVERLRILLCDVLDYAGWENPDYVARVRALHPGDLGEEPSDG